MTARGGSDPVTGARGTLAGLGLGHDPVSCLEAMVAAQLGRARVRVRTVDVRAHPYERPALTTAGRHLVCGSAQDDDGRPHGYAFFVKTVRPWSASPLSHEVPEPLRSELAPMLPWRTEPDLYRSDLGRHLPPGLRLARVYRVADPGHDSAVIWLERVPAVGTRWDTAQHAHAAYLLGRLAARTAVAPFVAGVPPGRTVRRFADRWLAAIAIPYLRSDEPWRRPHLASTFGPLRDTLLRTASHLPAMVGEIETFPTMTAHGDACPDNLLCTGPDDDVVLIDFGFWGAAPVGFDLAQLLLGDIQLGRRRADTLPVLTEVCLPAYVEGLRAEGRLVPLERVRRAAALTMAIFHLLPSIPYEHRNAEESAELTAMLADRAAMARSIVELLDATGGPVPGSA